MSLWFMKTNAVGLDLFSGRPSAHADHDRACQDRVGEVAEPGEGDGAIGGEFLQLDLLALDHAPVGGRASAMTGIDEGSDIFMFFGFGSEDRINLVIQDGGRSGRIRDLSE